MVVLQLFVVKNGRFIVIVWEKMGGLSALSYQ